MTLLHPRPHTRRALAEIRDAEDRAHAEAAVRAFAEGFGAKWSKAVVKVTEKVEALLAFYDFPAEHWIHHHPIEVTFATVRLRTKVTKGPGSKAAGLADRTGPYGTLIFDIPNILKRSRRAPAPPLTRVSRCIVG